MSSQENYKDQARLRFEKPHYRVLRHLGLFDRARALNRWVYRVRCERRALRGQGLVPEYRLRKVYMDALHRLEQTGEPLGDYLEFGVAFGSSMACFHEAAKAMRETQVRLFGFDSFEGLPAEADLEQDHGWFAGQIQSSEAFARKLLTRRRIDWSRTFLIKGWFKNTLTDHLRIAYDIRRISVVMIDSDLYSSAVEVLAFCEPLLARHSVILFDEWNAYGLAERNSGEKRAFDEFLARNPHIVASPMPSYKEDAAVFFLTKQEPNQTNAEL